MSNTVEFIAVQRFKVRRRSTDNHHWCISVEDDSGHVLYEFTAPTMQQAERDFEQAGYRNALAFSEHIIFVIPRGGMQ